MIPDSHIVERGIEFVAGSLGMRAAAPVFRVIGGFVWEAIMERAKDHTYDFVKHKTGHLVRDKIGLRVENHSNHLSIKVREKEFQIHHPTRDRTHERFTLLTHYMHPERFSPLLQEKIQTLMVTAPVAKEEIMRAESSSAKIPGEHRVMMRGQISIYD